MFLKENHKNNNAYNQQGFSLIEVLIALCILMIAFSGLIISQLNAIHAIKQIEIFSKDQTQNANQIEYQWAYRE